MNITAIREALQTASDSAVPTTEKQATQLADALRAHLTELHDWVTELEGLLTEVDEATDALAETDEERDGDKDREGVHGDWTSTVDQVSDHLAGLHAPA